MVRFSSKSEIKPLWIVFSKRWGGAEQVAISDLFDLANSGVSISLVCLLNSPVHAAAMRNPKIKIYPIDHEPSKLVDFAFARIIRGILDEVQTTLVHITDDEILWYLLPALWRHPDVSVIASVHAFEGRGFIHWLSPLWMRRLDYMIVLSESMRDLVKQMEITEEKKIKVNNLGLDFLKFDPAKEDGTTLRNAWGVSDNTVVIGSVGRLVEEMGHDTFVKAAASLIKYDEWNLKFVIVGEDPLVDSVEYLDELKALVKALHLEDHVIFTQLADNLPQVMSAFDVFVMPAAEEVPGLGALEALAMERAVVVPHVTGAREIVGNRAFGEMVRPQDAFDLQAKILLLLRNNEKRMEMGRLGRLHVLRHYDKKTRFLRTLDLYERCIRRRYARAHRNGN